MLKRSQTKRDFSQVSPCVSLADVRSLQIQCQQVRVEEPVQRYMLDIVRATRDHESIRLGVSPRGLVTLQRATQALAFLLGRDFVLPDDVKALVLPVLAHRMISARGKNAEGILDQILNTVAVH